VAHAFNPSTRGRQRQGDFWVRGQPDLQSEFQDSQGYRETLSQKTTKKKKKLLSFPPLLYSNSYIKHKPLLLLYWKVCWLNGGRGKSFNRSTARSVHLLTLIWETSTCSGWGLAKGQRTREGQMLIRQWNKYHTPLPEGSDRRGSEEERV
jgi:hypothetical protein